MKKGIQILEKEEKLFQFKKQLAWKLCSDLLSPPIPSIGSFRTNREDTEDEKATKRKDYDEALAQIELERKSREPELMEKLDEVIERVRNSRHEKLADNEEVWQTVTGSEIERPRFICGSCGNDNHTLFITDPHTGDTICLGKNNMGCGNVVQDHYVDEGQQYRKFADDTEDRNHHGPDYDPLMPDSENLKTGIVGTDALFKKLYRTHQEVEMNLSTIGNDDRRTRTAYRNRMKRDAFELMRDISANLSIHKSVLARAKEEFARFRDVREHVHNYHAVIAACLILAYEEISSTMDVTVQAPRFSKTEVRGYNVVDGLKKIVNSEELAISTLREIKIGKWSEEQVREWLTAILKEERIARVNCVINSLKSHGGKDENDNISSISTKDSLPGKSSSTSVSSSSFSSKKRKYPNNVPSFFGSTTISNRKRRYANNDPQETKSSSSQNLSTSTGSTISTIGDSLTFGQKLIVLNFDGLVGDDEADDEKLSVDDARLIKESLNSRLAYEAALDELHRLEDLQQWRLRTEKSSRMQVPLLNEKPSSTSTPTPTSSSTAQPLDENETSIDPSALNQSVVDDSDDIWAEVRRVSQLQAAIAATEDPLSFANLDQPNRGRRGTNSIFKIA